MRVQILLGILAAVMLPCPVLGGEADDLADGGYDSLSTGKYGDATEYFLAAIEKEKHHVRANTGLLKLYLEVGDYGQAIETAQSLAAANAATAQMLSLGGDACAALGKYKEAHEFYKKGLALDKGSLHALVGSGRMLALEGKKKESLEQLEKARETYMGGSGHPTEEMVQAAAACVELNRFADANTILGEALKKDPDSLDALVQRAKLFLEKYDYPYAKQQFEKALEKNPRHPGALAGLAWTCDHIGEPTPDVYDSARSYARKALRANRKLIDAHLYLAYSELMDGDYKQARSYVDKALGVNPNSADALGMAAGIFKMLAKKEDYEKVRKQAFEITGQKPRFLHAAASILQTKFRYAEALELSQEALKLDEDFWPAYAMIGLNMLRLGKEKEAKEYLKKSHDNDPFNIWTYNSLQLLTHMDDNYKEKKTEQFVIKAHGSEIDTLAPYVEAQAQWSCELLSRKYGVKPEFPVAIELFQKHEFFSARTIGLPGIQASGASFGPVVAMDSPTAREPDTYNWARTLHHELVHTFTLRRSKNRISRWFGEGLSVYEETAAHSHWRRGAERLLIEALDSDTLASIGNMEREFSKPRGASGILLAYYHAGLVIEYVVGKYGFDKVLAIIDGYAAGQTDEEIFKECLETSIAQFDSAFREWLKARFGKLKVAGRIDASSVNRLKDEAELNAAQAAAWAKLARAYLASGKLLDCDASMKKAQKLDSSEPELHVAQAELDMYQGFASAAKEKYLKAIAAGLEKTFDVHIALARLYLGEGKQDEAIEHLNRAAEGFPDDVSATSPYRGLYQVYNGKGEQEKAFEQLEKIVALSDMDLQARIALADRALLNKEFASAAKLLWDVVYMNPLFQGVHERLGDALYGLEDIDAAMTEFKTAIVVGGRDVATAYAGLAQCYFDKEDAKLAEENARKALELSPQNRLARQVLELLGKWSE